MNLLPPYDALFNDVTDQIAARYKDGDVDKLKKTNRWSRIESMEDAFSRVLDRERRPPLDKYLKALALYKALWDMERSPL